MKELLGLNLKCPLSQFVFWINPPVIILNDMLLFWRKGSFNDVYNQTTFAISIDKLCCLFAAELITPVLCEEYYNKAFSNKDFRRVANIKLA